MNFPLLICANCNTSDKESFLLLKTYLLNERNNYNNEKQKEPLITSSEDNNISTNNLEIIDYPYSKNFNEDETFQLNSNEINLKELELLKNGIIKPNFLDDGINEKNNYLSRNDNMLLANTSSGVINNEDSITQNKLLLKNLYSNCKKNKDNNENNNNDENNEKNNINDNNKKPVDNNKIEINNKKITENNIKAVNNEKKKPEKSIKRKKLFNTEKNIIKYNYKNKFKNLGIHVEYQSPDSDFFTKSIQTESQIGKNENYPMETIKLKTRINLKKRSKLMNNEKENLGCKTSLYNKNKISKKSRLPNFDNTEVSSKIKNLTINTFELYSNRKNNINQSLLFKKKLTNLKFSKAKKKMKNGQKKNTRKGYFDINLIGKPYLSFRERNEGENISPPLSKNNPLISSRELYKKLLLKRLSKNKNNFKNIISNYLGKKNNNTNFINIKREKSQHTNLSSKIYINPFETTDKNLSKINIKNFSKIKS